MKINNLEKFKAKVAAGETALGTVITTHDASFSELAADCGFDFVWIDMEHSPMTIVDVMHHVMALRGTDCVPFIRVPWNVNYLMKPVLDLAPGGVIIPMINDAVAAAAAVNACRYPIDGGERGFSLRRNNSYGKMALNDYMAVSRHEPLVILQIEHREAVRNIDELLQVKGVDSICIGPFDLSASYGKTACFEDPEILSAMDLVREKALKAGVMLGGFCSTPVWDKRFMNWKTIATDAGSIAYEFNRLIRCEHEKMQAAH